MRKTPGPGLIRRWEQQDRLFKQFKSRQEKTMGVINISFAGSFGAMRTKQFGAQQKGHAAAVAEVIQYLAEVEMPLAIKNDHECQRDGIQPTDGFGGLGKLS